MYLFINFYVIYIYYTIMYIYIYIYILYICVLGGSEFLQTAVYIFLD